MLHLYTFCDTSLEVESYIFSDESDNLLSAKRFHVIIKPCVWQIRTSKEVLTAGKDSKAEIRILAVGAVMLLVEISLREPTGKDCERDKADYPGNGHRMEKEILPSALEICQIGHDAYRQREKEQPKEDCRRYKVTLSSRPSLSPLAGCLIACG